MAQSPPESIDRLARLEARHRELLRALDDLNAKVERVLREFGRAETSSAESEAS